MHAEGSAQGPERVRKIETAIEIEKLEREIVTVIRPRGFGAFQYC